MHGDGWLGRGDESFAVYQPEYGTFVARQSLTAHTQARGCDKTVTGHDKPLGQ